MQRWLWTATMAGLVACTAGSTTDPTDPVAPTDTTVPGTVDPDAPCAATVASVDEFDPPAALQRGLRVTLSEPAALWASCTPSDDPEEALLVESASIGEAHEFVVHGLYAGADWTCDIAPACKGVTPATHTLAPVTRPSGAPEFVVSGTPTGAFTLFNGQTRGAHHLLVVDPEGRIRWALPLDTSFVLDVDAWWTGERMHIGGGWGLFDEDTAHRGFLQQVDLSGNVLYSRDLPAFGLGYNHHSEPMADGTVVSLTTSHDTRDGQTWYGVAVERLDPATDSVTFSWDSQGLADDGIEGPFDNGESPWHANALHWTTDPGGEALWISLFEGQAMWRVDPTTGERTHIFGRDGDFTLVDPSGKALPASEWAYAQHGIDVRADGRVLLYDNGRGRPGGNYSRVSEYQLDLVDNVATLLWTWTEPGWYTPYVGDVDYLPSGNVLIAKGVVQLATFNGQPSAIIEVDPTTDEVVWRLSFDNIFDAMFRAHRYDGCEMFASARYCDATADRLETLRGAR